MRASAVEKSVLDWLVCCAAWPGVEAPPNPAGGFGAAVPMICVDVRPVIPPSVVACAAGAAMSRVAKEAPARRRFLAERFGRLNMAILMDGYGDPQMTGGRRVHAVA